MLELIFFTSSRVKLSHAEYLCRNFDIKITSFRKKTYHADYREPRSLDREEILESSYLSALEQAHKAGINTKIHPFIFEDTSVVIEALSGEKEVPGVDIKYWMREIDFKKLDKLLKENGNNRNVIVRSDLLLHIPENVQQKLNIEERYKRFVSKTQGTIVAQDKIFNTSPLYPWLDNKTFNKWFAPGKERISISRLPIEKADLYDFRAGSFQEMLKFLSKCFSIREKTDLPSQIVLNKLMNDSPHLIISGLPCAGKTTIAEHLCNYFGYYHIEASDYMRLSHREKHGINSDVKIGTFAEEALKRTPEIVSKQLLPIFNEIKSPIVISGFRSPAEVEWLIKNCSSGTELKTVHIKASQVIRAARYLKRKRADAKGTKKEFLHRNKQEITMGVEIIRKKFAKTTILNEGSLKGFYKLFTQTLKLGRSKNKMEKLNFDNLKTPHHLTDTILITLLNRWGSEEEREYFTTTEIAKLTNELFKNGKKKYKDNISRFFNQKYQPYYDILSKDNKLRYRLSNTGYSAALEAYKRLVNGYKKENPYAS